VAQGVEGDVVELGCIDGVLVGRANGAGAEHSPSLLRLEAAEGAVAGVVDRHLSTLAALGHFEPQGTPAQVNPIPGQPE